MPMYDHECRNCGERLVLFLRISALDKLQSCPACGRYLTRLVSAPAVHGEITPYQSPVTGKMITSRNAAREDLHSTGYTVLEPGMREQIKQNRARRLEETANKVEHLVAKTAGELAASGRI